MRREHLRSPLRRDKSETTPDGPSAAGESPITLPFGGRWREVLNTDADEYGGYGVGNYGVVEARDEPYHGRSHSALVRLPALGAIWLTPER